MDAKKPGLPRVVLGCMRLHELEADEAAAYVRRALELGVNYFDHADIYGAGACESLFAKAVKRLGVPRDEMVLQSKCCIHSGIYDASKAYILESVDGILRRLETDHLDYFLLHRPDALLEPEEVAEAFDHLEQKGKVLHFGVSNFNGGQIKLLQKTLRQKIEINQMQFGLGHSGMVDRGIHVNTLFEDGVDRDGGVLDFCRLEDITVQAWSPFQYGMFQGVIFGDERYRELNAVMDKLAGQYNVSPTTIAAAWVLRHPAGMQLIAGTTKANRLADVCAARDIQLSRAEWYSLYTAAGHRLP